MNGRLTHKSPGVAVTGAEITSRDGGGFTAIASTGQVDRDGESVAPGCFSPLPKSVPVHLGHTMDVSSVVGQARPYYERGNLMVDVRLASTDDAQVARQKIADGIIDSLSIVFISHKWETRNGVRTCTKGELLAADIVSIPSNPGARILAARSFGAQARAAALLAEADAVIADAKSILRTAGPQQSSATTDVRAFLRGLNL